MRLIPPIAVSAPVGALVESLFLAGSTSSTRFAAQLGATHGFTDVRLFGSGRAALAEALAACRRNDRDEVVMPAYTCWSVPAAAVKVGLRVRLVDIDPESLDFEAASLEAALGARTAAVVAAHLFARSCDVAHVAHAARATSPDVRVIEDVAQAWPASGECAVDAAILSFGRGKPLALGGGGALLQGRSGEPPPRQNRPRGWPAAASLAATVLLARPSWYRLPEALPFVRIGETVFDPSFAPGAFFDWQGQLGSATILEMPRLERLRSEHARRLAAVVETLPGWVLTRPASAPGPLRLPILAPDRRRRDAVLQGLRRRGIAASAMYPGTLSDIPALRPHLVDAAERPGARVLAERLLTLPVYPRLTDAEVERIGEAMRAAAAECRS